MAVSLWTPAADNGGAACGLHQGLTIVGKDGGQLDGHPHPIIYRGLIFLVSDN